MLKKSGLILCVVFLMVVTAGVGIRILAQEENSEAESIATILEAIQGSVDILRVDEKEWTKAEQGQEINEGDKIKTVEDSTVDIAFASGAMAILENNSEMSLMKAASDYDNDRYKTRLNLLLGKVLVNVGKVEKESVDFKVETPVAVAAVRGTEFVVDATSKDDTSVAAFSGSVKVKKKGLKGYVVVKKNRKISIKKKMIKLKKPGRIDKKTLKLKKKFIRLKKKAKIHRKSIKLKRRTIKLKRKSIKTRKKSIDLKKKEKIKTRKKSKIK